jgi:tRNA A-37 threonylcarbamoyl transferase component Bud32
LNDVSPKIIYPTKDNIRKNNFDKIIVMELLGDNLMKYLQKENGNISISQQKKIINLFKTLDKLGILHGDPNPLNFLQDKNGDFLLVDYGFAKEINEKEIKKIVKKGMNVNEKNVNVRLMCLGLLIQLSSYMNVKSLKELIKHVDLSKRYIFQ